MKVTLLISMAVAFVTVCQASLDDVKCTVNELGIRWPNYSDMSGYYLCSGINGQKVLMNCEEGEKFSFVMQSCSGPNHFIPAPSADKLPTDSRNSGTKTEAVVQLAELEAPKPIIPTPQKKAPVVPSKKSPPIPGVAKKKSPPIPKPLKH